MQILLSFVAWLLSYTDWTLIREEEATFSPITLSQLRELLEEEQEEHGDINIQLRDKHPDGYEYLTYDFIVQLNTRKTPFPEEDDKVLVLHG